MNRYQTDILSKTKFSTVLLYCIWTVLIVGKAFGLSSVSIVYTGITAASLLFAILLLILEPGDYREILGSIMLYLLGILAWLSSRDASFILAVIVISLLKDTDLTILFKYTLLVFSIIAIPRMLMAALGFTDMQPTFYYERQSFRYGMGFGSPNTAQSVLTYITALTCIVDIGIKRKRYLLIALLVLSVYLYGYTGSRTGMIISIMMTVGAFLPQKLLSSIMRPSVALQWIIPAAAIIASITYDTWSGIVSLGTFGARFLTGNILLSGNYISLFGTMSPATDLGYIAVLCNDGPIALVILVYVNWRCARLLARKSLWNELLVLTCYAVYCVLEAYCTTITLNLGLLLLPILLFTKTRNSYLKKRELSSNPKYKGPVRQEPMKQKTAVPLKEEKRAQSLRSEQLNEKARFDRKSHHTALVN